MPEFNLNLKLDVQHSEIIELIGHISKQLMLDGEWPEKKRVGFEQDYVLDTDDMENILRSACPEFVELLYVYQEKLFLLKGDQDEN
tara:strand:+ start:979 stop:1236 length:258 start_codon:yes stop_codon:yes gene_type:complete